MRSMGTLPKPVELSSAVTFVEHGRSTQRTTTVTIARLLPLHLHGALEAVLGIILIASSFVLGFDPGPMIVSLVIGSLILGLALVSHGGERNGLAVSTHAAFDLAFAMSMAIGAIVFGFSGDALAGSLLAGGAFALLLLSSLTRYSTANAH
jgi:hypothetical protein